MSTAPIIPFHRSTKVRERQYIIDQYHKAHPEVDASEVAPHLVAEWAIAKRLYDRPPVDPVVQLRRELSRHLRNEYVTDPQGREVRKNHPVMIPVTTPDGEKLRPLYRELYHAPLEHMRASFSLRRRGVERDVMQMEIDFRSYNDNNVFGTQLDQMDYDFNKDRDELDMPTTYPDGIDDDDEIFSRLPQEVTVASMTTGGPERVRAIPAPIWSRRSSLPEAARLFLGCHDSEVAPIAR